MDANNQLINPQFFFVDHLNPDNHGMSGPEHEAANLRWSLSLRRDQLLVQCHEWPVTLRDWTCGTVLTVKVVHPTDERKHMVEEHVCTFAKLRPTVKFDILATLDQFKTDDGTVRVETSVTVTGVTGVAFETREGVSFDEPMEHISDAVLQVGDRRFHVSKCILSAESPHFQRLLHGNDDVFKVEGVAPDVFEQLLKIVYQEPEVTEHNVETLIEHATQLQMTSVRRHLEQELIDCDKSIVSIFRKLMLAEKYGLEHLLRSTIGVMRAGRDTQDVPLERLSQRTRNSILLQLCHNNGEEVHPPIVKHRRYYEQTEGRQPKLSLPAQFADQQSENERILLELARWQNANLGRL